MDSNLKSNIYNKKRIKNKSNIFFTKKKSNRTIEYLIHQNFIKKYKSMPSNYNTIITNNIIFNDKTHIVSEFKEYLVIDDEGEFLKRYYNIKESIIRLPKYFKFYFLYSKLFPNYTSISENKFLYNNIHQKQRMIDLQEKMEKEKKINKYIEIDINFGEEKNSKVFSTDIINSLLNATNKEGMEILFDVPKENLTEEENNFKKGVNQIVDKINDCQNIKKNNKKNIFVSINSIYTEKNKNNRIKNIIFKSIKSNNKENISQLSNQKLPKIKTINRNKIINRTKARELKNNDNTIRNKLNINNNISNRTNNEKSKIKNSKIINEKVLIEKLEKELFKLRKKLKKNKNYLSQNISTSIQSKKDLSLSKKNASIFNNKNGSSSLSNINLFGNANYPSARGRSTKISSSNSFIKEIKKKNIQKYRIVPGNLEQKSQKNLTSKLNNSKVKNSRNKKLQTSSTATNLFNNIIKYVNRKYIDSRNKKNISINTNTKIGALSYVNRIKNTTKKRISINNYNNFHEYETQNNKEFDLNNRIRKLKKILNYNKGINHINISINKTTLNKPYIEKILKTNKSIKLKNINSFKKINVNFKEKKTLENNKFCYSTRNLGRNDKIKNKLVTNYSQTKLNLSSKSKYNSKDNSYKKNILSRVNKDKFKINDIKMNSFIKGSFILVNSKKDLLS